MNKIIQPAVLGAVLVTGSLTGSGAMAEIGIGANIGVTSNYVFRGGSESNNLPAVSGGIDIEHSSGIYLGAWTSSLGGGAAGYELDGYIGLAGEAGPLAYDAGFIYYAYPLDGDADLYELYGSIGYRLLTVGVAWDPDAGEIYSSAGIELALGGELSLGLLGGYSVDAELGHAQASIGLGEFAFAVDRIIQSGADTLVSATWIKEF